MAENAQERTIKAPGRPNPEAKAARDRKLAVLVAMGFSAKEVCQLAGCHRHTLEVRMRDPGFRSRVRKHNIEYLSRLQSVAVRKVSKALIRLEKLAEDPTTPAAVKVAANKALIEAATRTSSLIQAADQAADTIDTATEQCPL